MRCFIYRSRSHKWHGAEDRHHLNIRQSVVHTIALVVAAPIPIVCNAITL
jgi:hypothetical protein